MWTREGGDATSTLAFRVLCALEPDNGCLLKRHVKAPFFNLVLLYVVAPFLFSTKRTKEMDFYESETTGHLFP